MKYFLFNCRLSNRTLVEDGMSLNGTTLFELRYDQSEHSVRCILNIENWTTWLLTDPLVWHIVTVGISAICTLRPLCSLLPGRLWRGIKQWVKTLSQWNCPLETSIFQYGTATRSCGTISWQIEGLKLRLIVMWSVPFNLNVHSSYLAVGMVYNEGRFSSSGMCQIYFTFNIQRDLKNKYLFKIHLIPKYLFFENILEQKNSICW